MFLVVPVPSALAEIKVFEVKVEKIVGRDQSQEQVEAFALQKAKRLAVEEAGTYISSLTVVRNYQLEKDEITALASGVLKAKIIGIPSVRLKNGVIHIEVKSRIEVDTGVLDRQIEQIMKDREILKELKAERRKVKELENKLASLKSTELKRLEELNTKAIALEREREKQRLLLAEQVLKARVELKKAETERLQKEREMQSLIETIIAEQERTRREEAEKLARERDRIRRARLENEQRWSELARKSQLAQAEWLAIVESLSFKQAIEEVRQLRDEISNLNQRMDLQHKESIKNLRQAFKKQMELAVLPLPPDPPEKDLFETTEEYKRRLADYASRVKKTKNSNQEKVEELKAEETGRIIQAQNSYLMQMVSILKPFINRLQSLQERTFSLPKEKISVTLGRPDADNSRFPLELQYNNKRWTAHWKYTDLNRARDLWKTRNHLQAQGLFQLEGEEVIKARLTQCHVSHPAMEQHQDFILDKPQRFSEIEDWNKKRSKLFWLTAANGDPKSLIGKIVHVCIEPAYLMKYPSEVSIFVVERVDRSTDLKVVAFKDLGIERWILVDAPSGNKGWIKKERVAELKRTITERFWDATKEKHYRFDRLGNRVYE